jgi:hypothetical protein
VLQTVPTHVRAHNALDFVPVMGTFLPKSKNSGFFVHPKSQITPNLLSAQTAVAFVKQTAKCFLSLSNFEICFKLVESMVQFCLLSCFFLFSLSLSSTVTKLPEVTHWLSYFENRPGTIWKGTPWYARSATQQSPPSTTTVAHFFSMFSFCYF